MEKEFREDWRKVDKMKKELKEDWLKALRSGKYKQTKGALCKTTKDGKDGFCCLGVLADICSPHIGKQLYWEEASNIEEDKWDPALKMGWKLVDASGKRVDQFDEPGKLGGMFGEIFIQRYIGLGPSMASTLADLNDNKNMDFGEIADWIEKNVEVEE